MLIFGKSESDYLSSSTELKTLFFLVLNVFLRSEDKSDGEARAKAVIREKGVIASHF